MFSGLEWKLCNAMKESNVQLPNQTGKLTDKITMRYVFQIFSTVITIVLDNGEHTIRQLLTLKQSAQLL